MKAECLPALDTTALLQAILVELRSLRADLAQHRQPGNEALAALLRAIHGIGGDVAFSVAEVLEQARAPGARTLHDAVIAATGGALNSKKLGQFLRTFEGVAADGLEVRRLGMDKAGVIWCVKARAF